MTEALQFEWSVEQPRLARCTKDGVHNCFMIHVDDLLFTGVQSFGRDVFANNGSEVQRGPQRVER